MLPRQLKSYSTSRRKLLFNFVKEQADLSRKDITLTPVNEHRQLHNLAEITLQSTSDDLEKTLTPAKPTSSDCNITNSELMQKEQETTESSDEKTNYVLQKFKIEITIEPESPDTDSITVDKAIEINNDSNNLSDEEQNEGLNAENCFINDCEIDTSLRSVIGYYEEKNNKKNPKSINLIKLSEADQEKLDVEGIFLKDSEENLIEQDINNNMNLNPLDSIDQPSRKSVDEKRDRLGQPGTSIRAIPVEVPAVNDINELTNQVSEFENQNQLQPKKLIRKVRKRKGDPSEWRDNKNKKLKNSGQAYEGARNKKHHEKKNILSNCACKKGCGLKFNTEDSLALHTNFYKLANREFQWQYITRHVKSNDVKRVTVNRKSNRSQTLKYYFPLKDEEIQVCKVFFKHSFYY